MCGSRNHFLNHCTVLTLSARSSLKEQNHSKWYKIRIKKIAIRRYATVGAGPAVYARLCTTIGLTQQGQEPWARSRTESKVGLGPTRKAEPAPDPHWSVLSDAGYGGGVSWGPSPTAVRTPGRDWSFCKSRNSVIAATPGQQGECTDQWQYVGATVWTHGIWTRARLNPKPLLFSLQGTLKNWPEFWTWRLFQLWKSVRCSRV